jgi:hypothetical protein
MRKTSLIASITLSAALLAGGVFIAAPVLAQAINASPDASTAQELSIKQIIDQVEAAGYRNIKEIEREDDGYEVKATAADGRRAELYLDPVSGEITKTKIKDSKREN